MPLPVLLLRWPPAFLSKEDSMYQITIPQGETYLTEKANYIRKHPSGVYLLTDAGRAEDVAFGFCV